MANTDRITALLDAEIARKISDKPKKPFARFANFKFEGVLKRAGDTVTVPISPKITLTDVSSSNSGDIKATSIADITASDRTMSYSQLAVNKLHQYREKFSDLEEIQTAYSIKGERMQDLIDGMETAVEGSIITMIDAFFTATSATLYNVITASTFNVNNCANIIMKLRTKMSQKELPMKWRILVVSPEVSGVLAQAKILAGTESGVDGVVEGWIGKFAGFDIYESNLITGTKVYAFLEGAYNYVRQLYKAKVTEAEGGMYYNLLAQIAHGGKVFDQNAEQLFRLDITSIDSDTYTQEVTVASSASAPLNAYITNDSDHPVNTQEVSG